MQPDHPDSTLLCSRAFGEVVRARRLELGLSVTMLANWAATLEWDIETIERGERPAAPVPGVHLDLFARIAWGLRWTPAELTTAIVTYASPSMHPHANGTITTGTLTEMVTDQARTIAKLAQ